jgi:hypothetical protein
LAKFVLLNGSGIEETPGTAAAEVGSRPRGNMFTRNSLVIYRSCLTHTAKSISQNFENNPIIVVPTSIFPWFLRFCNFVEVYK